jgi:alpha-galactosidase
MCEWGVAAPWHWAKSVGNSWRTDADIAPSWDSVLRCLDNGAAGLAKFAGPGGWNDPDMLEVKGVAVELAMSRV